ncbi:hypothetical protein BVIET440_340008 [Burkholderia vietnamiensis]
MASTCPSRPSPLRHRTRATARPFDAPAAVRRFPLPACFPPPAAYARRHAARLRGPMVLKKGRTALVNPHKFNDNNSHYR